MDGKSLNITQENINQLKQIFPQIFKEDKVDFLQLKALLGVDVIAKDEAYSLSWAGKYEAFKEIQKQTTATLIPDREGSIDFDNAENIFIEGENLEVLRVLQKSYYGKIKMIYIDPPYNTGNDFIYNDKFAEHKTEYLQKIGAIDEDGNIVNASLYQQNTRESGRFHSIWLSLMYPRLYLAKNLLKEDGVIFISIDDNEVHNLRLLLDELFGEENFIGQIVWRKRAGGGSDSEYFSIEHEYILIYAKNKDFATIFRFESEEKNYPFTESKGRYTKKPLNNKGLQDSKGLHYDIICPDGEVLKGIENQWVYSEKSFLKMIEDDRIIFEKNGNNKWNIKYKLYLHESKGKIPTSILYQVAYNKDGNQEIKELNLFFDYPKPSKLLKTFVNFVCQNNTEDIILDFFAGSGTTAQAVLELNEEDGGNRKFICVQLNEKCKETGEAYKAGYKTIADITKARITRVIQKIETERNGKMQLETNPQSLAFKSYRLADSNFKKWNNAIIAKTELAKQLQFHIVSTKEGSKTENMLQELILKLGLPLTTKIENKNSVFYVIDYKIAICLETFNLELRQNIIDWKPRQVVILDSLFESDEFLTNAKLRFKEHDIELTVI